MGNGTNYSIDHHFLWHGQVEAEEDRWHHVYATVADSVCRSMCESVDINVCVCGLSVLYRQVFGLNYEISKGSVSHSFFALSFSLSLTLFSLSVSLSLTG